MLPPLATSEAELWGVIHALSTQLEAARVEAAAATAAAAAATAAVAAATAGGAAAAGAAARAGQAGASHAPPPRAPPPSPLPPLPPPPFEPLRPGSDDVARVAALHAALLACGFWVGDEEADDFVYGAATAEALATFQACASPRLPETGVLDAATWAALARAAEATDDWRAAANDASSASSSSSAVAAAEEEVDDGDYGEAEHAEEFDGGGGAGADTGFSGSQPGWPLSRAQSDAAHADSDAGWPVLRSGDGGSGVCALQALLSSAGFHPSADEARYWSFGPATEAALLAFQASVRLAETGVADAAAWRGLAGGGRFDAGHDALVAALVDAEQDMTREGVWLLGEERWERLYER